VVEDHSASKFSGAYLVVLQSTSLKKPPTIKNLIMKNNKNKLIFPEAVNQVL